MHGVEQILDADYPGALEEVLGELFTPIAPTLRLLSSNAEPTLAQPPQPTRTDDVQVIAWQHRGHGVGGGPESPYASARLQRRNPAYERRGGFGTIVRSIQARPYRGRRLRLRAWIKVDVPDTTGSGAIWLRVDRPDRQIGFFDNMSDRPIRARNWRQYEILGPVADDASRVFFGTMLLGKGHLYVDQVELAYEDADGTWQDIPLANHSFDDHPSEIQHWATRNPSYAYMLTTEHAHHGPAALAIVDRRSLPTEPLFPEVPSVREWVRRDLGAGLACAFPAALHSRNDQTLPASPPAAGELQKTLSELQLQHWAVTDHRVRLATVVIAWNALQHFSPYLVAARTPGDHPGWTTDRAWDRALTQALSTALTAQDRNGFHDTLRRMVAQLGDGGARVRHLERQRERGFLPWRLAQVEGRVVVMAADPSSPFRRGDLVRTLDGFPVARMQRAAAALFSGSSHWRGTRSLQTLGAGRRGELVRISIERDGRALELEAARSLPTPYRHRAHEPFAELPGGAYYVDLTRIAMDELVPRLSELATAPGVIFDLRGEIKVDRALLAHLLVRPIEEDSWMRVAHLIYPDRQRIAGWTHRGWQVQPAEPRIERPIFLSGPTTRGPAESVLAQVKHRQLGPIVGSTTAGSQGERVHLDLPGGYRITWTGTLVTRPDGGAQHMVGIRPDIEATPTLAAVARGDDEVLARAQDLIARQP